MKKRYSSAYMQPSTLASHTTIRAAVTVEKRSTNPSLKTSSMTSFSDIEGLQFLYNNNEDPESHLNMEPSVFENMTALYGHVNHS